MIARIHRFHGHASLPHVYRRGQTLRSVSLNLRYVERPPQRPYRLGVVVSRKVSKHAVVRNRIRRRVYEAVRGQSSGFLKSYDLVITIYDEKVATQDYALLYEQLEELFIKAHVLPVRSTLDHGIVKVTGK